MDLDKAIRERHCVRDFKKTKKPIYTKIIRAIESASLAPLAGNLPSIKYILVSDKDKIKELAEAAQQDFISDVNHVVVICTDIKQLKRSYYDRAIKYAQHQAGAVIENFLLKITDLGLASCWVGAFTDDMVKRILKIPDEIEVEAILPIGSEMPREKPKKRKPDFENSLYFDKYKNKFYKPLKAPEFQ